MAVQDALWSTSVQCRGLTPGIFQKGLQEKFGDHYDLATLTDKDIVGAVQDYKVAHVDTLFAGSPRLHDSPKARFEHEKLALGTLAEADATLAANGVTVPHASLPAPAFAGHPGAPNGHVPERGTLRLHDHGAQVEALQRELSAMHYRSPDGHPLRVDGRFGPATQAAVQAFQRDHHLHADGIAGPRTLGALHQGRPDPSVTLEHPAHAGHAMYGQALRVVHELDARQGRAPDHMSTNFAGSLAAQARTEGLTRIDHLVLSDDANRAYVVQGDLNSPFKQYASVEVAQAVVQPLGQSSHDWTQAHVQQQLQVSSPSPEMSQHATAAPTMSR